jgi:hypothetical protein
MTPVQLIYFYLGKLGPEDFVHFLENTKSQLLRIEKNTILTAYLSQDTITPEEYYENIQNKN